MSANGRARQRCRGDPSNLVDGKIASTAARSSIAGEFIPSHGFPKIAIQILNESCTRNVREKSRHPLE